MRIPRLRGEEAERLEGLLFVKSPKGPKPEFRVRAA